MSLKEPIKRALATFIFGATSSPIPAVLADVSAWWFVLGSGVAAVWNLAYRMSEAYLRTTGDV